MQPSPSGEQPAIPLHPLALSNLTRRFQNSPHYIQPKYFSKKPNCLIRSNPHQEQQPPSLNMSRLSTTGKSVQKILSVTRAEVCMGCRIANFEKIVLYTSSSKKHLLSQEKKLTKNFNFKRGISWLFSNRVLTRKQKEQDICFDIYIKQ